MVEPLDVNSFTDWIYEEFGLPTNDIQEIDLKYNLYENYLDLVKGEMALLNREYDEINKTAIKFIIRKYSRL